MDNKKHSTQWKRSVQPRKQRKYTKLAPLHVKQTLIGATLSKDLRKKMKRRSTTVRRGDKVKVMRGQYKGRVGKVEQVDLKKTTVHVAGIDITKKDGAKTYIPIHPSNLMITDLLSDDKKRQKRLTVKPKEEKKNG